MSEVTIKYCKHCDSTKEINLFHKDIKKLDGVNAYCEDCWRKKRRSYHHKHKEVRNKKANERYHAKKVLKGRTKKFASKKEYRRDYYLKNKEKIIKRTIAYTKKTRQENMQFKLQLRLRNRLRDALKKECKKLNINPDNIRRSAVKDLGCTPSELKSYIEKLFKPGMSWSNWGLHGWHLDHIKALSTFNLQNPEEIKKACHFTNLQPLWAAENWSKGKKHE